MKSKTQWGTLQTPNGFMQMSHRRNSDIPPLDVVKPFPVLKRRKCAHEYEFTSYCTAFCFKCGAELKRSAK